MAGHGHEGSGGQVPFGEDKTPPANLVIFITTIISVVCLAGLKPAFDAYFDWLHRGVVAERLVEQQERANDRGTSFRSQREAWDNQLRENAETPIEEAVAQLGTRGRLAWPSIRPETSRADGPVVGWGPLAEIQGPAMVQPEPPPPEPAPAPEPVLGPDGVPAEGIAPDNTVPAGAAPAGSPAAQGGPIHNEAAPQEQ